MGRASTVEKYPHCGRRVSDLKAGRLITFTGTGSVRSYTTGYAVKRPVSLLIEEVSQLRGTGAAIVDGMPVNKDGTARKNGNPQKIIVKEGSFFVWW